MMNLTATPSQDIINAFFFTAKELNEDIYVGDILVDDEGKAMTSVITAEGKVEQKPLVKDLQEQFQHLIATSATKTETVSKMLAKNAPKEEEPAPDFMSPITEEVTPNE